MTNKTILECTQYEYRISKLEEQFVGEPKYVEVERGTIDQLNKQLEKDNSSISITKLKPVIKKGEIKTFQFEISENIKTEPMNESVLSESSCKKVLIIGNKRMVWSASNDILKLTAEWLFQQGRIQRSDLPVYVLSGQRYILNKLPIHRSGREYDGKPYNVENAPYDVYLNTNFSTLDIKKQARYLMERFSPNDVFKILGD